MNRKQEDVFKAMVNLFKVAATTVLLGTALTPLHAQDAANDLVFSEICYNPYGTDNLSQSEWAELYNRGESDLDLSGYQFKSTANSSPPVFTFPSGTVIPAGGYLVVAPVKRNLVAILQQRLDPAKVIDLDWPLDASHFTNGNGKLTVLDPDGVTVVAEISYKAGDPWPTGATSNGRSIELNVFGLTGDSSTYYNDPANWTTSEAIYGTPAAPNSAGNANNLTISGTRNIEFPGSADTITISGQITTDSGSVTSAQIFVNTTGGNTYTASPLTLDGSGNYTFNIGPLASETLVKYYIQAEDSSGFTKTEPLMPPAVFFVDDNPVSTGDVVINEVMFNPSGGDNSTNSEYVEIYNNRSTPVNLSYFQWGRYLYLSSGAPDPYVSAIPEGTILQGHSYLVLAGAGEVFLNKHPDFDTSKLVSSGWLQSAMSNSGSPANSPLPLAHPNAIEWNGAPTVPFEAVQYEVGTNGWPGDTDSSTSVPDDADGESIELVDSTSDRNVGSNWKVAVAPNYESPGEPNSVSNVSDWNLY